MTKDERDIVQLGSESLHQVKSIKLNRGAHSGNQFQQLFRYFKKKFKTQTTRNYIEEDKKRACNKSKKIFFIQLYLMSGFSWTQKSFV